MVFPSKTKFYLRLTDKEWAINWNECSQKYWRPYIIIIAAIDNHSPIIVDEVILPNNCLKIELNVLVLIGIHWIWLDLIGFDWIWLDLFWIYMIWFDLIWFNLIWFDRIWFDLIWFDLTWLDLTWLDLTWLDLTWLVLT